MDCCIKLFRIIEVNSEDMWSANILLSIWVLRGHLREQIIICYQKLNQYLRTILYIVFER